jgi:hypothetical protein
VDALVDQRSAAKPQEIANTLWAAATMGQPLPADTWAQLVKALTTKAADAIPQAFSSTFLAAAKQWGNAPDQRVAGPLLALAGSGSEEHVAAAKPQDLANSLWALSELRLAPQQLVGRLRVVSYALWASP